MDRMRGVNRLEPVAHPERSTGWGVDDDLVTNVGTPCHHALNGKMPLYGRFRATQLLPISRVVSGRAFIAVLVIAGKARHDLLKVFFGSGLGFQ